MIVIARNNGPFYAYPDGVKRHGLITGKEYQVIEWAYRFPQHWVTRTDDFINPKEAKLYIKVINEDGVAHDYWNDYFLSTEEVRELKIWQLGI